MRMVPVVSVGLLKMGNYGEMWCWEMSSPASTEPANDLSLGNIMPNERVSSYFSCWIRNLYC